MPSRRARIAQRYTLRITLTVLQHASFLDDSPSMQRRRDLGLGAAYPPLTDQKKLCSPLFHLLSFPEAIAPVRSRTGTISIATKWLSFR